ncbi:unnamed protein product [Soboliphyme baturini]|uniref:Uncharacterized protein n=1 Tax=Soboliphyme baturini TaxID=241478 RepID=A0A183IZZ4_9BILA|nr:unnamed protein product [Soboliphyme baturini]
MARTVRESFSMDSRSRDVSSMTFLRAYLVALPRQSIRSQRTDDNDVDYQDAGSEVTVNSPLASSSVQSKTGLISLSASYRRLFPLSPSSFTATVASP